MRDGVTVALCLLAAICAENIPLSLSLVAVALFLSSGGGKPTGGVKTRSKAKKRAAHGAENTEGGKMEQAQNKNVIPDLSILRRAGEVVKYV